MLLLLLNQFIISKHLNKATKRNLYDRKNIPKKNKEKDLTIFTRYYEFFAEQGKNDILKKRRIRNFHYKKQCRKYQEEKR